MFHVITDNRTLLVDLTTIDRDFNYYSKVPPPIRECFIYTARMILQDTTVKDRGSAIKELHQFAIRLNEQLAVQ